MTFQLLTFSPPDGADVDPRTDFTELRIIRHPNGEGFTLVDCNSHSAARHLTPDELLGAIARYAYHPDGQIQFGKPIRDVIEDLRRSRVYDRSPVHLAIVTILRELDDRHDFPTPPLAFLSARQPL